MNVEHLIDRTAAVRLADDPGKAIKQRIQRSADDLSLAGKLAERLAIANEGIFRLTQLVYQADTDGGFANVDAKTGAILIPLPWGKVGHQYYNLRQTEANLCRMILLGRQRTLEAMKASERAKYPQLYYYAPDWRKWFANLDAYPTFDRAAAWLRAGPLTLAEWKTASTVASQQRAKAR